MNSILREDIQIRDPFIVVLDGYYYMFGSTDENIWGKGTSRGFQAYKSQDLNLFEGPYDVFEPQPDFWGTDNFWAPEIHVYNNAYYMFATFRDNKGMRGTGILRSNKILGPYIPWTERQITPIDWMSLDGTLYVDKFSQPWLVFCHEWVQIKNGEICAMPLSLDLKRSIGKPVILFHSTDVNWSTQAHSSEHGMTGWVTDGPNIYKHSSGALIMTWSCISDKKYAISCAISESGNILGPWKHEEKPLEINDGGHGMLFKSLDDKLMITIHQPNDTPHERAVFIPMRETTKSIALI